MIDSTYVDWVTEQYKIIGPYLNIISQPQATGPRRSLLEDIKEHPELVEQFFNSLRVKEILQRIQKES